MCFIIYTLKKINKKLLCAFFWVMCENISIKKSEMNGYKINIEKKFIFSFEYFSVCVEKL